METVGDDLDAPLVADGRVEVHISQAHVPCNPRASFATHACDVVLEQEGSGGTRGTPELTRKQPTAAAVTRRKRQGMAKAGIIIFCIIIWFLLSVIALVSFWMLFLLSSQKRTRGLTSIGGWRV